MRALRLGECRFDAGALSKVLFDQLGLPKNAHVHVAFSGGLDSVALLHALVELRKREPINITALHANHGLHPDADRWSRHCVILCEHWSVPINTVCLNVRADPAVGLEASARAARYRWFESQLEPGSYLLMAHHCDDQVETVLLNLLRGAGAEGLSGMRPISTRGRIHIVRPLLGFGRSALSVYVQERRLKWVDDSSNRDVAYARNYLRHRVVPVIRQRWPSLNRVLGETAVRMHETFENLAALAAADLGAADWETVDPLMGSGGRLRVSTVQCLSDGRLINVLRYWLRRLRFPPISHYFLRQVADEMLRGVPNTTAVRRGAGIEIRRFQDWLFVLRPLPPAPELPCLRWDGSNPIEIPGLDVMLVPVQGRGQGLARARIGSELTVRWRRGGEKCRLPGRQHRHSLKKLLQEHCVPPWIRDRIPLLYSDGELCAAVGLFYCAPHAARGDEPGVVFDIRPLRCGDTQNSL